MPSTLLQRIRRLWVIAGSFAFAGFVLWCLIAYRASAEAHLGLVSDSTVEVVPATGHWTFQPTGRAAKEPALVFLAGALVDPIAYAPLLHAIAAEGYPVHLFALPWRGVFGLADDEEFLDQVRSYMDTIPGSWVIAGHSRGAKIASLVARQPSPRLTGLILVGSTHPRDFSLAQSRLRVTKLYGTRDGVAPAADVLANASLLPATTVWVPIEGGNHHQFGYYGFQPGDRFASISRAQQQIATVEAILTGLEWAASGSPADTTKMMSR